MTLFVVIIIFNLSQVYPNFHVLFDDSGIDINGSSIEGLALGSSILKAKYLYS